jgi:hypothetical protein
VRHLLFLLAAPVFAQSLTVGVKGGLRLTSAQTGYGTAESKRYLAGPAVEVGLPLGFGLEADALYSRLGYTTYFAHFGLFEFDRTRADAWEFPILVKYRPVYFGIAPRHASGQVDRTGAYFGSPSASTQQWHAKNHAWVVGGAVHLGVGHLRFTPEVRYLHWKVPRYPATGNIAYYMALPDNEVRVLVGVGWRLGP